MVNGISSARAAPPLSINETGRFIENLREAEAQGAQQRERAAALERNATPASEGEQIMATSLAKPAEFAKGRGVNGADRNPEIFAARKAQEAHQEAMRGYNQQREAALAQAKKDSGAAILA